MPENVFQSNVIEKITYRQQISVDRWNLETLEKSSSEFVELFCSKLSFIVLHGITATDIIQEQCKTRLKASEFVVYCDFSENYSFVVPDDAQNYH